METPALVLPAKTKKLLLHSCCAPCSGEIIKRLISSNITFSILFYNPNIDTENEYLKRKNEVMRFANKMSVSFFDFDYDNSEWVRRIISLEQEPERGKRCTACFSLRLEMTALFANENKFDVFTTSLGISRWKDFKQVCLCGYVAAKKYPGLVFWDYNWRKNGGSDRMEEISKQENFYRQTYCGCIYSKNKSL